MPDTAAADAILIFDLDGTLFHTETVTVPAARTAFAMHGLEPPPDAEICAFIGRTSAEYNAWLRTLCPPPVAEALIKTAAERELELIGERGRLYPGVAEALRDLRGQAATLALCSNGSGRYVEAVLVTHEIDDLFDEVRFRRPGDVSKAQMVGELVARFRRNVHQAGIVVGDRHDDIEAARLNGLLAVGCAYGYGTEDELEAADAVAKDAVEMAAAVQRLLAERGARGGPDAGWN
jgi:phosphoglycolate phosphatase-like HAD superfamily hydrolase